MSKSLQAANRELLTFTIGAEEYCIDILKVQEIRGYDSVTRIANTPEFIKGVINLRGNIVPIIDLRLKLGLDTSSYDETTVVIILNLSGKTIGAVVDGVSDVITLDSGAIRPAPEFGAVLDTQYILGLAPHEERMLILVDIEKLIGVRDMAALGQQEGVIQ
jgi:purine-binding chemotaxis protein CheW